MKTKNNKHIRAVKDFLANHWEDDEIDAFFNAQKGLCQGDTNNKYYVLLEGEYRGCYSNEGIFASDQELVNIISDQCGLDGEGDHRTAWDRITVLDIDAFKIEKPAKITWK